MRAPAAILVLAAGQSSRMRGRDKLLEVIDGQSLLRRVVERSLATGAPVLVVLPTEDTERTGLIDDLPVTIVRVENAEKGMSASLRAGIAALPQETPGVLIMLADMPDVSTEDLNRLLDAFSKTDGQQVVRASDETGNPGNPVVLPARLFDAARELAGDTGARRLLKGEHVLLVPLPGAHATTDLDTPADWDAWRARRRED